MDKNWSDKNKKMQTLISKEATFANGIKVLFELCAELFGLNRDACSVQYKRI